MFYVLSKLAWIFLRPSNIFLFLVIIGTLLSWTSWEKLSRLALLTGVAGFIAAFATPLAVWVGKPLEERFPKPLNLQSVDGIVVLGGGVDINASAISGTLEINASGDRLTESFLLAQKFPNAKIVYTGGAGHFIEFKKTSMTEAEIAADFYQKAGLDMSRVILENKALNTWQNAVNSLKLVQPKSGETWLLVTSGYHMPRAMGVFRQAGWDTIVAYPVDLRQERGRSGITLALGESLFRLDLVTKEWIGMIVYRLTGRSSAFFPKAD
jgi:uncharacterized SAM-binding protein YcdF (DUF218 family)